MLFNIYLVHLTSIQYRWCMFF